MSQVARTQRQALNRDLVLAQVREMAEELDAEEFFQSLEAMIDQVRKDLELIPEPEFRAELRELFREVIDYALSVKLEHAFTRKPN